MLFKFTGTDVEQFPTIVTEAGTLVCAPGDVVDLADDPGHPRLVPTTATTPPVAVGGTVPVLPGVDVDAAAPAPLVVRVVGDPAATVVTASAGTITIPVPLEAPADPTPEG